MSKLDVSAVLHSVLGEWRILVSVQDQDGKPVTGLKKENFTVGAYASENHISWNAMITLVAKQQGSAKGGSYYTLKVEHKNSQKAWNAAGHKIVSVAAHTAQDRGQCLAHCPNECCLDIESNK